MNPFENVTPRQKEVYQFIREKIRARGYGPTVREIGLEFGINSPNGVVCHLKALERKGLIKREPNMSRAIQLMAEPAKGSGSSSKRERGFPLVGQVAAGSLTEAIEQNDRIDFDEFFSASEKDRFVLKVHGESMIDDHIADGDLVVVRKQATASAGQIVVVQTDEGDATLKRWFPEKNRIRLQPANAAMAPIYVKSAKVLGVVEGVVRKVD